MLRTQLDDPQRAEVQVLRQTDLPPVARTRLEMVFLSDAGWSAAAIGRHLGHHPHTVRSALKGFRERGPAAFHPNKPGPEPDHERRAVVTAKLTGLLGQERTWTSQQLADALAPDVRIGRRQTRRYLALLRAGYRRTAQTVGHKQDPAKVARAEVVLSNLKKKRRPAD